VGDLSGDGVDAAVVWNCTNGDEVMGEYGVTPLVGPGNEPTDVANPKCFQIGDAIGPSAKTGSPGADVVSASSSILLRYPWANVRGGDLVGLEANIKIVLAA